MLKVQNLVCLQLDVFGQVQGVGLRPFLYRIAHRFSLKGRIYNHNLGATALLIGERSSLENFVSAALQEASPPIKITESVCTWRKKEQLLQNLQLQELQLPDQQQQQNQEGIIDLFQDLRIENPTQTILNTLLAPETQNPSHRDQTQKDDDNCHRQQKQKNLCLPPDRATCPQCWEDFHNPQHRLFAYPFISCTECGPRWSILRKLPFERDHTSLEDFPLCETCRSDYASPESRRFHAQTLTCADCGPRLSLHTRFYSQTMQLYDEMSRIFANIHELLLKKSGVGLVKGMGGFQLIANALDPVSIERVRKLKQRPEQSLGIMLRDFYVFQKWGGNKESWKKLTAPEAPMISMKNIRVPTLNLLAPDLQGMNEVGIMAPTTPLHALLFSNEIEALIVTSGNRRGQPIPRNKEEIKFSLQEEIDFILDHNRQIEHAVDDSVLRQTGQLNSLSMMVLRKARGLTPEVRSRPYSPECQLALGADLKNAAALAFADKVIELPYAGSLGGDDLDIIERQQQELHAVCRLLGIQPDCLFYDIHPMSATQTLAGTFRNASRKPIAHHQAHAASAFSTQLQVNDIDRINKNIITNNYNEYLILTFDGTGMNEKLELGGSEGFILQNNLRQNKLTPVLSLIPTPLIGGDQSVVFPWRSAAAMLALEGVTAAELFQHWDEGRGNGSIIMNNLEPWQHSQHIVEWVMKQSLLGHGPVCASMGRWFDALASLLEFNLRRITYEAQAPIRLEGLATSFWDKNCKINIELDLNLHNLYCEDFLSQNPHNGRVWIHGSRILKKIWDILKSTKSTDELETREDETLLERIAFIGHALMAKSIAQAIINIKEQNLYRFEQIFACGGVFQNEIFYMLLKSFLQTHDLPLQIDRPQNYPVNDQSIALGQLQFRL